MPKTLEERLPGESEHPTTARAFGVVAAVAVALVLVANVVALRCSPAATRSYDGRMVDEKWRLASTAPLGGSAVVIGDSSGNFGIDAAVLGRELQRPAYNLCTYGRFQVTGAAWFLDRALDASEAPPAVVLAVFGARSFALDPDGFTFAQIPAAPLLPPRGAGLGLTGSFQYLVARVLPLFVQAQSFGRALTTGEWRPDLSRLVIEADGTSRIPAANPPAVPPFAERTLEEYAAVRGPVPSERERRAVERLVRDAESRGYDLVFVPSPVWDGLAASPAHQEFDGRVRAFLTEACSVSTRARVLPGPVPAFPAEVMENPFHLVQDASVGFTEEIARRVVSLLESDQGEGTSHR